jgi:hypothetical protein
MMRPFLTRSPVPAKIIGDVASIGGAISMNLTIRGIRPHHKIIDFE